VEIATLPSYPTPEPPFIGTITRRSLLSHRERLLLDLGILTLIVLFVGWLRWTASEIERARNPVWVYDQLAIRHDFDELGAWCGLRQTPVTEDEAARLREQVASDPKSYWCVPDDLWEYSAAGRRILLSRDRLQWVRLQDPNDPGWWIVIGVYEQYMGLTNEPRIVFRVPVGLPIPVADPPAEANPGGR
jgi:hypothetical protein